MPLMPLAHGAHGAHRTRVNDPPRVIPPLADLFFSDVNLYRR